MKRKILLFSTLNPYPYWAGSENLWFDFVSDKRVNKDLSFHVALADSPVTRKKARELKSHGVKVDLYKHFNTNLAARSIYRVWDSVRQKKFRSLPWYNEIKKNKYDLVWFNVAALGDLQDLYYPVQLCKKQKTPYLLLLQHGDENFFLSSEKEIETVTEVATSASKFIFIAKKNRSSLERAIGKQLSNAFHSVNALPASKIEAAFSVSRNHPPASNGSVSFFNLGRFSPRDKGQHLLLQALADEKWRNRDWKLSFIGISDFGESYLRKMASFLGLDQGRMNIAAHTDNVFAEIVKHDLLLMPSLAEGTPFAMIETMACGRPALGTPVGGIPELILEKQTGWLSKTTDIRDVSDKLEEVWQERNKWKEYGLNAQKHVEENFNGEKSFIPLLEIIISDTVS